MSLRFRILTLIVFCSAAIAGILTIIPDGRAQSEAGSEAKLAAAAKALDAGQYKSAVQKFTQAMRADGLSTNQVAQALYMRGVANRNADLPAQAISDITSALWLKGLSNRELAQARMNRALAYRAVGLDSLAQADVSHARQLDPNVKVASAPARSSKGNVSVPAFTTQVQSAGRTSGAADIPSFRTQVKAASRPSRTADIPSFQTQVQTASRKSERQPIPSFQTSISQNKTRVASRQSESKPKPAPSFRTSILPDDAARTKSKPAVPASTQKWNTSVENKDQQAGVNASEDEQPSTVGRFLSGLWKKKKDDGEPASAGPPAPVATTQWNQKTRVATAPRSPSPVGQPASTASPAPTPSLANGDGAGYRIQLAAVRSQEEADATWKRLSSRHKSLLGGRTPVIRRTDLGSLGTFYRIQLGPFSDKKQSTELCNSFKRGGLDCFILAR